MTLLASFSLAHKRSSFANFDTNELQSGLDPRREDTKNYVTFVYIPGTPFRRGIHKQLKPSSAFHKKWFARISFFSSNYGEC
jgi:hypothetical protein